MLLMVLLKLADAIERTEGRPSNYSALRPGGWAPAMPDPYAVDLGLDFLERSAGRRRQRALVRLLIRLHVGQGELSFCHSITPLVLHRDFVTRELVYDSIVFPVDAQGVPLL